MRIVTEEKKIETTTYMLTEYEGLALRCLLGAMPDRDVERYIRENITCAGQLVKTQLDEDEVNATLRYLYAEFAKVQNKGEFA